MRRRLAAWGENFGLLEPDPSGGGYSAAGWAAKAARSKEALGGLVGRGLGYGDGEGEGGEGERAKGLEEVRGEELYVMPGWAVVKYRQEAVGEGAPGFAALPGLNPEDQPMGPIPTAVGMALLEEADDGHESTHRSRHERVASRSGTGTPPVGSGQGVRESANKGQGAEGEVEYGVYQSKRRRPPPLLPKLSALAGSPAAPSSSDIAPTPKPTSNTAREQYTDSRPPPGRAGSMMSVRSTDSSGATFVGHEAIASAHETLQRRIAPFWSTILPNRRVLVDVYAVPPSGSTRGRGGGAKREAYSDGSGSTPDAHAKDINTDADTADTHAQATLTSFEIITDSNGHFSRVITIPWEKICTTPAAVAMAFEVDKRKKLDWEVRVRTRLDYEVFEYESGEGEGGTSRSRGGNGGTGGGGGGGGGGGYRERIRRAMATYGVDAIDGPSGGAQAGAVPRMMPPRPETPSRADSEAGTGRAAGTASTPETARTRFKGADREVDGQETLSTSNGREGGGHESEGMQAGATGGASQATEAAEAVQRLSLNTPGEPQVIVNTLVKLGSEEGIHVISDLDDTVKHSDILSGPREVFRNVFCRPLEEIVVPEMNDMYRRLDDKGVAGFHFVSNSPSQLFPSIRRFLTVNGFPNRHSIKLKYYGGRSIFSSLYESPAERKRASLKELFEAFPRARFVMLGDSAEQDLELYIEFARLYEGQVAMIAIRDVTSDRADEVLQGVQGAGASGASTPMITGDKASMPGGLEDVAAESPSAGAAGLAGPRDGLKAGSVQRMAVGAEALTSVTRNTRPMPIRAASSSSSSLSLLAGISEDDLRSLSSSQQKIVQRAATWQTRMNQAWGTVPDGTAMCFFKEAWEVEGMVEGVLASKKGE